MDRMVVALALSLLTRTIRIANQLTGSQMVAYNYLNLGWLPTVWHSFRIVSQIEQSKPIVVSQGKDRLTETTFTQMIEDWSELDDDDIEAIQRDTTEIYRQFLDPSGKGFVTPDDIRVLSQDSLKKIVRRSEAPHGPVAGSPEDRGGAYKLRKEKEGSEDEDDEQEREHEVRDELWKHRKRKFEWNQRSNRNHWTQRGKLVFCWTGFVFSIL